MASIRLTGRSITREVEAVVGVSLLKLAQASGVDWQFNCSRGTCARCRCRVEVGTDLLADATDAEWDRLEPDELDAGYRLGCQAVVVKAGTIVAVNRPYY